MMHSVAALLPALLLPPAPGSSLGPSLSNWFGSAPGARDLLAALPDSTFLAVHGSDPRALVAARETNDWVAFAMDPEWQAISTLLLGQFDEEAEATEMEGWRQMLFRALGDSTGFVAFVGEGFGDGDPILGIMAEGGDECAALLRTFVSRSAAPHVLANGEEVLLSEAGRGELFHSSDGFVLALSAPSVEAATRMAVECMAGLDGPRPAGPFAVPAIADERRPAALEMAVDMSQLWKELERVEEPEGDFQRRLFDAASSMAWMYASVVFGEGDELDWEFVLPYGAETLLGQLVGFFGEADRSLLRAVPARATGAVVASFDLAAFTEWALALVREVDPDAAKAVDGALVAAAETASVDVLEDVLGNATGSFLSFSSPTEDAAAKAAKTLLGAFTLVVAVEDAEPLVDLVDTLVELGGVGAQATSDAAPVAGADEELEIWRFDESVGARSAVGAGAGRFVVSTDVPAFDDYLARLAGNTSAGSLLDDPAFAETVERARGAIVSVQSMGAAADSIVASMRAVGSTLDAAVGIPRSTESIRDAVDAMERIALLMKQYFDGVVLGELRIEPDRIRYRTTTR
ncbi:MAG: hypothetical protein AAGB93_21470 [Planctomycetota bacterium]